MTWDQKPKQKPVAMHIPEWKLLHEIGEAMEKQGHSLPSVRHDSHQWKAWRTYLHSIGLPTAWSDKQPDEYKHTVTLEWPPVTAVDLDALHTKWVKGSRGSGKELKE